MTIRHRLLRLEHSIDADRHDKQQQWLRGLSDEELDDLIAELRARTSDEEWVRIEQAVQDGPAAVQAYLAEV